VGRVCTVIVAWKCFPDAPVVVAANRDELLGRPSDPPTMLQTVPPRWGGRDRLAGGTWLAVDPAGRVGAVTNRHPGGRLPIRDAARQSRGRLPLDVLKDDDEAAHRLMQRLRSADYNPVNVLYASTGAAYCTSIDDDQGTRTTGLSPGIHVVTEQDLDDPSDAKVTHILTQAQASLDAADSADDLIARLRLLLQSHEAGSDAAPACIHAPEHGTVSSATVVISTSHGVRYEHAEGPPCTTPFETILPSTMA
jgi:uncharacterized protein with NRDE domain